MNNDLIVMIFDNQQDALKARGALEIMRNSAFLGAMNAVPATKDGAGKVVIQVQQPPLNQTGADSWIPNALMNSIFGESEDELQELVDAGLDESFQQMVKTALKPGGSMILIYIRYASLVDTQQVLEAIKQYNGTLYHTTITSQVEEAIMRITNE
jgi:uncharacterized membrane protein